MGLNDHFTLSTQKEDEAENRLAKADVFAPTALGEAPQLRDSAEFIAVPDETLSEDAAALETICIRLRDIQLFGQEVKAAGGISMNMALEALDYLPTLVTAEHPKEFYTQHVSRTSLSYALEQEEVQSKNFVQRAVETVRKFFARIVDWFKAKFNKLFNKDALDAAKAREKELQERLDESNAKVQEMAEKYDQLKRASSQDNDNYLKELANIKGVEAKLRSDLEAKAAEAKQAKTDAANAEESAKQAAARAEQLEANNAQLSVSIENLKAQLRDVREQMRNLDATKSREIAEALDRLERLQRQAESSRSARLDLQEKSDELRVTVNRIIVKVFGEKLEARKSQLQEAYNEFARARIIALPVVSKYMLGNGLQKRTQAIQTKAELLVKGNAVIEHVKRLKEAVRVVETDPEKLIAAIKQFDFSSVSTGDDVQQKTEFSTADLQGQPAARLEVFIKEMQQATVASFQKVEAFKFNEISREFEELSQQLAADTRLKMDYKFANPVVEAYRQLQAHIAKLLPVVQRIAQTTSELITLSSALVHAMPSKAAFMSSEQYRAFVAEVIAETAAYVSVSNSFIRADDKDIGGVALSVLQSLN